MSSTIETAADVAHTRRQPDYPRGPEPGQPRSFDDAGHSAYRQSPAADAACKAITPRLSRRLHGSDASCLPSRLCGAVNVSISGSRS
jgi:hypothetical protein